MLIVKNVKTNVHHQIQPTVFPDGTSQVWKLPLEKYGNCVSVCWFFEKEAELIHLRQLLDLLSSEDIDVVAVYIPFLPYGRQDKEIDNNSTFALHTFLDLLPKNVNYVTLDVHSQNVLKNSGCRFHNITPIDYIQTAIKDCEADIICYPDWGARERYFDLKTGILEWITMKKIRDQSTGNIVSQDIDFDRSFFRSLPGKTILIIDDLCDGGWTFTLAAKWLRELNPSIGSINLYVTHGIFSKGRAVLHDGGIDKIFTTRSLRHNIDGYELPFFNREMVYQ